MNSLSILHQFERSFSAKAALLIESPGRVNLIGEHTDYNGGLVMPAAIDRYIWMAMDSREGDSSEIISLEGNKHIELNLLSPEAITARHLPDWTPYFVGAAQVLKENGFEVPSTQCVFGGNIPIGAGLSSSAALSCAVLTGMAKLCGADFSKKQTALMAQEIEHRFIGVNCGIMDQMACLFGKSGEALLLDCDTLDIQSVPIADVGGQWFLIESGVQHNLASSAYNDRCRETAEGLDCIAERIGIDLRFKDLKREHLSLIAQSHPTEMKRLQYYMEENERVLALKEGVKGGMELNQIGDLLTSSHRGLRDLYEVTCEETDLLVDLLIQIQGVHGARQIGGGFGGCVLAFAENRPEPNQIRSLITSYRTTTGLTATHIPFLLSEGCTFIDNNLNEFI